MSVKSARSRCLKLLEAVAQGCVAFGSWRLDEGHRPDHFKDKGVIEEKFEMVDTHKTYML